MRLLLSVSVSLVVFTSCTEAPRPPLATLPDVCATAPAGAVDFRAQVQPLLEAKCAGCHREGGAGPFSLETPGQMRAMAGAIRSAVCRRAMPPWPPHRDCNSYAGDRSLTDEELVLVRDWVDSGADVDGAVARPLPPVVGLSRVDRVLQLPEPYLPTSAPDDYRCFVMDLGDAQSDQFITGFGVEPDAQAQVHHVVVFRVSPDKSATYTDAEAAFEGPGYPCFGGPAPAVEGGEKITAKGVPSMVGVWAPGVSGVDLPAGTGIRITPGTKLVVQMHYNLSAVTPGYDRSKVLLKLDSTVEREAFMVPFANPAWVRDGTMTIPAGAADAFHAFRLDAKLLFPRASRGVLSEDQPWAVHGGMLHMHTRGTRARLTVERDTTSRCVNDIPSWDFHWQGMYFLREPMRVETNEEVRLECHWNNEGPSATTLNWGEGTGDEMCVGFLYVTAAP
jgi:hypothetical protein